MSEWRPIETAPKYPLPDPPATNETDLAEEARQKGEDVERYVQERIDSIRRGARRHPKRFRL